MSEGLQNGTVIAGKFRILSKLGEGGMGAVYAGEHVDLRQKVAIKVILAAELGDEMLKRFRREALVLAQLESEHAVRVMDYGTLPDDSPYLVMEFLKGMDLDAYLRRHGPVSVAEAAEIGVSVCDALADAHTKGIVHRDLKPSNLFLVDRPNGRRVVKVLDFGLSLRRRSDDLTITHTNAVLGTPLYAAPEQFNASKDADGRADIWSLGASLYELVTGRVPFPAATLSELAKLLREGAPPASSINPNVPAAFSDILLRCLQRKLTDRYPNVVQLRQALRPFRALGKSSALFGEAFTDAERAAFAVTEEAPAVVAAITPTEVDRRAVLAETEAAQHARGPAGTGPSSKKSPLVPIAIGFASLLALSGIGFGATRFLIRTAPEGSHRAPVEIESGSLPTAPSASIEPTKPAASSVASVSAPPSTAQGAITAAATTATVTPTTKTPIGTAKPKPTAAKVPTAAPARTVAPPLPDER